MFKLISFMCLSVVIARWGYDEIELVFPRAVPVINYALEKTKIPTHDQWDTAKMRQVLGALAGSIQEWTTTTGSNPNQSLRAQTGAPSQFQPASWQGIPTRRKPHFETF